MVNVTVRNQLAIRRHILEEFENVQTQIATNPESWRKLSFEAHKELCKVVKWWNFINYPEFEFWFSRFARGDFELDYDRRADPKTRSFTDLPLDVFEKVGEYLELEDRMELRNVCKDIRAHVDNWELKITEVWYYNASYWKIWQTSRPDPFGAAEFKLIEINRSSSGSYRNPISFLTNMLKHPKLRLEKLMIDQQDDYWKKFIRELDESNQKLHVKKVEFRYNHSAKNNWHFMFPGVLEKIILIGPRPEVLYEIIESEQCQAAKMLYIQSWDVTSRFPLDDLYNCPRFTLLLGGAPACSLKAPFLKRLMKYGEVQTCVLYNSNYLAGPRLTLKYFNEPKAMVPNFPSLRRYSIPETNEFHELEYREDRECREELGHRGRLCHKEFVRLERKQ